MAVPPRSERLPSEMNEGTDYSYKGHKGPTYGLGALGLLGPSPLAQFYSIRYQHVSTAVTIIMKVIHKSTRSPYQLLKCISEPCIVTRLVLNFLHNNRLFNTVSSKVIIWLWMVWGDDHAWWTWKDWVGSGHGIFQPVSRDLHTEALQYHKDCKAVNVLSRIRTRCLSNTNKKLVPLAMLLGTLMVFFTFCKCYLLYTRTVEEICLGCCANLTLHA
jgi:hypothetical protein